MFSRVAANVLFFAVLSICASATPMHAADDLPSANPNFVVIFTDANHGQVDGDRTAQGTPGCGGETPAGCAGVFRGARDPGRLPGLELLLLGNEMMENVSELPAPHASASGKPATLRGRRAQLMMITEFTPPAGPSTRRGLLGSGTQLPSTKYRYW